MSSMIMLSKSVTVFDTRSGAVYVYVPGTTLVRFKGYDVSVFPLESGLKDFKVGEHIKALWLPEGGVGVERCESTRITRVSKGEAGQGLTLQYKRMVTAAVVLDSVGKVCSDYSEPDPELAPVQKAVLGALAKGFGTWDEDV